jgi:hypothetical protein
MLLVDRIKENQEILNKNPKVYIWSCVQEVDNRPMLFEIRKKGSNINISCRAINGLDLFPEDIAEGYINNTIAEDVVRELDRKDWKCAMTEYPQAQLDLVLDASDKSMYIEDMFVSDFSVKDNGYETKLMMFLQDLCANVGCTKLKALASRDREFMGRTQLKGSGGLEAEHFTERSYEKFLSKNGFSKKFFSSVYSKEILDNLCLFNMKRGSFGIFNERTTSENVLAHIDDNTKSM